VLERQEQVAAMATFLLDTSFSNSPMTLSRPGMLALPGRRTANAA